MGRGQADIDRFNRFWRGIPPKSKGDYAFITHMIEAAIEKEGRVAVVAPLGVLFRGSAEGRIRQKLIDDNLLDAVVALPSNLFPSTSIPVAILVFDRSREKNGVNENKKDVIFIDGSKDFLQGKNQNYLLDHHIKKIISTYQHRKEVKKYSYVATTEEIVENEYNLNIPRYVDTFEDEKPVDVEATQKEISALDKELKKVRETIDALIQEVGRNV